MIQTLAANIDIKGVISQIQLRPDIGPESTYLGENIFSMLREMIRTKNTKLRDFLLQSGIILGFKQKKNIIALAGKSVVMQALADENFAGPIHINYGLLGTGNNPNPVSGSTQLINEVYRKQRSTAVSDNNITYVEFFYDALETNGTYTEFANVIGGDENPNTGSMWSYISTGGWVKNNIGLFVSCEYTAIL